MLWLLNPRNFVTEDEVTTSFSLFLLVLHPLSVLAQVGRFPHNLSLPSLPVVR